MLDSENKRSVLDFPFSPFSRSRRKNVKMGQQSLFDESALFTESQPNMQVRVLIVGLKASCAVEKHHLVPEDVSGR